MLNRDELELLHRSIRTGIRTGELLLRKLPAGSVEYEQAAKELEELHEALLRCEKLLDEPIYN
jgi:hypothetical protein